MPPSPRTASDIRNRREALPEEISVVGWNWISSMSQTRAPARAAAAMPSPTAPSGLVVYANTCPMPPVAMMMFRLRSTL